MSLIYIHYIALLPHVDHPDTPTGILGRVDGCDAGVVQKRGILFGRADDVCCFDAGSINGWLWTASDGGTDPCRHISRALLAALHHLGMPHCLFSRFSSGRGLFRS